MVFSTPEFLFLFFPAVFILYYLIRRPGWQNLLLIAASLFFYAYAEGLYVLLMLASVGVNYLFVRLLARRNGLRDRFARGCVCAAVCFNIGMLAAFKYAGLFVQNARALPVGISFFTFQALSLVLDVYRGKCGREGIRLRDVLLYISLFPQLIAGPIVQYGDVADALRVRTATVTDIAQGMRRFTCGLAKKLLLANVLAVVCDGLYALEPAQMSAYSVWLAAVCYMLQIYFDFSGYSDMAIGLGRLFGFRFRENFDLPYCARGMRDFWRRWHISLSTWFRDYLYIPLGGSRGGKLRTVRNRMIVFACTGLWHGANPTFLVWGLWNGVLVTAEGLVGFDGGKDTDRAGFRVKCLRALSVPYTLLAVLLGFVLFRAESLSRALLLLRTMFTGFAASRTAVSYVTAFCSPHLLAVLAAAILFASGLPRMLMARLNARCGGRAAATGAVQAVSYGCTVLLLLRCMAEMASSAYNPFIYFRF